MKPTPEYLKYESELKKIDLWTIILNVIALLTVIQLLFVPFFCTNPVQNVIDDLIAFGVVTKAETEAYNLSTLNTELVNFFVSLGYSQSEVEALFQMNTFSLYDEFRLCIESIFNGNPEILASGFFALITPLFCILAALSCIGELCNSIMTMNRKDYTIKFNRIKNNGEDKVKMTSYAQNLFVTAVMMCLLVVFYTKFLAASWSKNPNIPKLHMSHLTGVSPLIALPVILFISYYVIFYIKSHLQKSLTYKIISDEEVNKNQLNFN